MGWEMMNDQEELKMLREDIDTLTNLLQKMSEHIMLLDKQLKHHETVWARIDNDVQLFGNKVVGYGLEKQDD